mmetsp:Transcript_127877/g.285948  ORF Transcript_127877/g.285948 Transcript_127877/m.285948 type:complete len:252 (+) Transcript_127877:805-1560(+)
MWRGSSSRLQKSRASDIRSSNWRRSSCRRSAVAQSIVRMQTDKHSGRGSVLLMRLSVRSGGRGRWRCRSRRCRESSRIWNGRSGDLRQNALACRRSIVCSMRSALCSGVASRPGMRRASGSARSSARSCASASLTAACCGRFATAAAALFGWSLVPVIIVAAIAVVWSSNSGGTRSCWRGACSSGSVTAPVARPRWRRLAASWRRRSCIATPSRRKSLSCALCLRSALPKRWRKRRSCARHCRLRRQRRLC